MYKSKFRQEGGVCNLHGSLSVCLTFRFGFLVLVFICFVRRICYNGFLIYCSAYSLACPLISLCLIYGLFPSHLFTISRERHSLVVIRDHMFAALFGYSIQPVDHLVWDHLPTHYTKLPLPVDMFYSPRYFWPVRLQ